MQHCAKYNISATSPFINSNIIEANRLCHRKLQQAILNICKAERQNHILLVP